VIRLEHISFRYRSAQDPVLRDVSCHIRRGELVGLLGRSGSGRSTLASTLNGTIPHLVRGDLTGRVLIDGQDIRAQRPRDLADRIGFVFQDFEAQLFSTNVSLEVAFGPENLGVHPTEIARRVDSCLGVVRLSHLSHKAPAALSGGQKQRLALASVLALEPTVLILDEPTSDLDPNEKTEVIKYIKEIGKDRTILLSTHNLAEVEEACARAIIVSKGRVVADGPIDQIRAKTGRVRYVLTVDERDAEAGKKPPSATEIQDALSALERASGVRELPTDESVHRFELAGPEDTDLRASLFRLAVAKGWTLLELRRESQSLDAVFRDLTREDQMASRGLPSEAEDEDEEEDEEGDEESEEDEEDEGQDDEEDEDAVAKKSGKSGSTPSGRKD